MQGHRARSELFFQACTCEKKVFRQLEEMLKEQKVNTLLFLCGQSELQIQLCYFDLVSLCAGGYVSCKSCSLKDSITAPFRAALVAPVEW